MLIYFPVSRIMTYFLPNLNKTPQLFNAYYLKGWVKVHVIFECVTIILFDALSVSSLPTESPWTLPSASSPGPGRAGASLLSAQGVPGSSCLCPAPAPEPAASPGALVPFGGE